MASLLETKTKIKATKQTRKITKAMQLVSASKMKVFQKKAVASRGYAWDLLGVLQGQLSDEHKSVYMEERKSGKTVFVLYSSEKGLCGALNTKLTKKLLQSPEWTNTPEADRLLVTIGRKAEAFADYNEIPVEQRYKGLKENMKPFDALEFIKPILDLWTEGGVKQIYMIAPHYKSAIVFYPVVKTFLPFSFDMISEHLNVDDGAEQKEIIPETNSYMYFEPDKEHVIATLFEQIIQSLFLQAFFELKAAEYSSRMMAMQNATDNASEMIDKLTLLYNKGRQAKVTQELSEISGAMASME
ncbi:MAG: ATP synthase F1 subunit gamma [Candidatus Gracilibacteria bacterium]|nr:ATP synthase F1 subunit gamma [Candidatus Gracilibacteria bacterium]